MRGNFHILLVSKCAGQSDFVHAGLILKLHHICLLEELATENRSVDMFVFYNLP